MNKVIGVFGLFAGTFLTYQLTKTKKEIIYPPLGEVVKYYKKNNPNYISEEKKLYDLFMNSFIENSIKRTFNNYENVYIFKTPNYEANNIILYEVIYKIFPKYDFYYLTITRLNNEIEHELIVSKDLD